MHPPYIYLQVGAQAEPPRSVIVQLFDLVNETKLASSTQRTFPIYLSVKVVYLVGPHDPEVGTTETSLLLKFFTASTT